MIDIGREKCKKCYYSTKRTGLGYSCNLRKQLMNGNDSCCLYTYQSKIGKIGESILDVMGNPFG